MFGWVIKRIFSWRRIRHSERLLNCVFESHGGYLVKVSDDPRFERICSCETGNWYIWCDTCNWAGLLGSLRFRSSHTGQQNPGCCPACYGVVVVVQMSRGFVPMSDGFPLYEGFLMSEE